MPITVPHPLLALTLASGGFVSGLSGFGSAILSQLIWGLLGTAAQHILNSSNPTDFYPIGVFKVMYPILSITDTISALYYIYKDHKHIRWSIVKIFTLAIPAVIMGVLVLAGSAPTLIASLLGLFFLSVATQKLYEDFAYSTLSLERREQKEENALNSAMEKLQQETELTQVVNSEEEKKPVEEEALPASAEASKPEDNPDVTANDAIVIREEDHSFCARFRKWDLTLAQTLWGVFAAVFSGITGGAFGMGGPPGILYLKYLGINKTEIRATFAVATAMLNPIRIALAIPTGIMSVPKWDWYVTGIIGAFSGMYLGFRLHQKVSQKVIMRIMMFLILISSSEFIQLTPLYSPVTILSAIVVAGCFIALIVAFAKFFEFTWCETKTPKPSTLQ